MLAKAYQEFDRNLRIRQAKVAGILALFLMLAGVTLDYFVYPTLLGHLFRLRVICDVALLPCVAVLYTTPGRRYIEIADKACILFPTLSMCWMIYASEGTISPYYAGLNLVITGACLLFPYSLAESVGVCLFVLASYTLACVIHPNAWKASSGHSSLVSDASTLYNNLYFLSLTSIIAATACRYNSMRRFEDFRLRHELDVNNHELTATLKKLKETEVQLVQSEKMNALGKLSAGLLHEVNNPLNFTFMALQMAEQEAEGNESLQDTLKDIGQGMTRIRGVISDLRAFAYPSSTVCQEQFSVQEALNSALRLTAHEVGEIPIDQENLAGVMAAGAKTQIVHVLMNLVVNAVQAMRGKDLGRPPRIKIFCEPRGDRLVISVRDNGTGVKPADLHRLLEPFFTTKEVGQGMGLGLSICHTIVKNHGGNIDITSEEGQWTCVSFDLPRSPDAGASGDSRQAFTESSVQAVSRAA